MSAHPIDTRATFAAGFNAWGRMLQESLRDIKAVTGRPKAYDDDLLNETAMRAAYALAWTIVTGAHPDMESLARNIECANQTGEPLDEDGMKAATMAVSEVACELSQFAKGILTRLHSRASK